MFQYYQKRLGSDEAKEKIFILVWSLVAVVVFGLSAAVISWITGYGWWPVFLGLTAFFFAFSRRLWRLLRFWKTKPKMPRV
jgi:hypothetical protein